MAILVELNILLDKQRRRRLHARSRVGQPPTFRVKLLCKATFPVSFGGLTPKK